MRQRDRNKTRRVERQEQAATRALAHSARTPAEQLDALALRGHGGTRGAGMALRETLRLTDAINEAGSIGAVRLA